MYNTPHLPNLSPSCHIKQTPGSNALDTLSTVTNTDTSTVFPHQKCVKKKSPINEVRKIANGYMMMSFIVIQFISMR